MILAVDIGNTNIVIGGFENSAEPSFVRRIESSRERSFEQLRDEFLRLLSDVTDFEGSVLSSVVPELTENVRAVLQDLCKKPPVVLDHNMNDGLEIVSYDRKILGNDRVADCLAALDRYEAPIVIFDLGTATTMSVLDDKGRFLGGVIIPGIKMSVDALSEKASQLPEIELAKPQSVIATDVYNAMRSGAVYGTAAQIDGLIDRVEETLGKPVTAVLTGGLSRLIRPYCRRKTEFDEYLLLRGLKLLYEKNK